MATLNLSNPLTKGSNKPKTGMSLGFNGNTLRVSAEIRAVSFGLREVTEDPSSGKTYGALITGARAVDIVTTYNTANADRILAKLSRNILAWMAEADIIPAAKTVASGQSVQDRCDQYIRGIVLGAVNTCPTKFSVAGKTYIYEPVKVSVQLEAADAIGLIRGESKYFGDAKGDKVNTTTDVQNSKCVSEDLFTKAMKLFCDELKPHLEGNKLMLGGKLVAEFVSADDTIKDIVSGTSNYDEAKVKPTYY